MQGYKETKGYALVNKNEIWISYLPKSFKDLITDNTRMIKWTVYMYMYSETHAADLSFKNRKMIDHHTNLLAINGRRTILQRGTVVLEWIYFKNYLKNYF